MAPRPDTRREILGIARDIVARDGIGRLSFDAIARELGRTKQAVLYWFPTKPDLLAALFLPCLEEETRTAESALASATDPKAAVAAFVRAIADFHLGDLDRFRLVYVMPQTARPRRGDGAVVTRVHPVTDRLYASLAVRLNPDDPKSARPRAAAIHAAVLGQVLLLSLADALNDPLKHTPRDLSEALTALLCSS